MTNTMGTLRRGSIAGLAAALGLAGPVTMAADPPAVQVFKTPTCGCCAGWVKHLEANGFRVSVTNMNDLTAVKQQYAIPGQLSSCHTALVGGYVVEGHVPAADIWKLLKERPRVTGLVTPGMPIGSPGMEGPDPERYQVLTFDAEGRTTVFATHGP
jgi:hypothetical protein